MHIIRVTLITLAVFTAALGMLAVAVTMQRGEDLMQRNTVLGWFADYDGEGTVVLLQDGRVLLTQTHYRNDAALHLALRAWGVQRYFDMERGNVQFNVHALTFTPRDGAPRFDPFRCTYDQRSDALLRTNADSTLACHAKAVPRDALPTEHFVADAWRLIVSTLTGSVGAFLLSITAFLMGLVTVGLATNTVLEACVDTRPTTRQSTVVRRIAP